jgi:hypothetical protein
MTGIGNVWTWSGKITVMGISRVDQEPAFGSMQGLAADFCLFLGKRKRVFPNFLGMEVCERPKTEPSLQEAGYFPMP